MTGSQPRKSASTMERMLGNRPRPTTARDDLAYVHGIRANLGQFSQQLLQVFFVGLTIGLQRNVVPVLAEEEFGVSAGSFTLLMAFIISFGFVKGAMNFVAGRLSERVGRRKPERRACRVGAREPVVATALGVERGEVEARGFAVALEGQEFDL